MSEGNSLKGRVGVITGAAGGIGRAVAHMLHAAGAQVILTDLDQTLANTIASELGDRAQAMMLNVADEQDWKRVLASVVADHEKLDFLVNVAGFYQPNIPFEDMPLDVWQRHFSVNSDGTFLGCKHAIRYMKQTGEGAIVNLGSGMSIKANPIGAAYCASKASVLMTTRCAAAAAGPYGVRVNAVLPGAVDTPMLRGNITDDTSPEAYAQQMASYSALGRIATPDDIARAVMFLVDPANAAITGIYIDVDGGNLVGA
ncbi:SDR family NAD(P)-dependent oxidoreductase [Ponticaulis profundi]|uniref:SDR family NAD(P)-dependent oxidoreductase n=1 Tax=Ponticaulis profundi TaxID=2665222 RepID=A0ABW1S9Q8_9PROT